MKLLPFVLRHLGMLCLLSSAISSSFAGNDLDKIVAREQQKSGLDFEPLPVVRDGVFMRRVYVDLIGRIPTDAEMKAFAAQPAETRRASLIDQSIPAAAQ